MTSAEFVKENHISMSCERVGSNPNCPEFKGYHWRVVLTRRIGKNRRRYIAVFYSTGLGCRNPEPKLMDILECLKSASYVADRPFEAWAEELDFNPDSRADLEVYKAMVSQTAKLRRFLGDTFEAFLACID